MQNLPGPLKEVVDQLSGLPGIGPKSALRIALTLLKMPREKAGGVGQAIIDLRERLCLCDDCACLAESSPCAICSDPSRDSDQLCLVPEWDALLAMEEMGIYRGKYLVLGGLLSPLDGVDPGHLEIDRLRRRLASGEISELILALGATLDAEATASYVKNLVESELPGVCVSRLAQGIPIGGEVKFMDKETLKQSLVHRQKV
ncbi:recombination mediator RecR [Pseudodesulfovibrio sp. S3]|uniref:recombination mediator RecR n=1 Tax=unclassified Pseudodesulfovibrio TaxID=2661612 RepID=UPI000FEB5FF4|nr:recombination mediator RecR [Pseudodesulfovibrio sp. S3]MCJ2163943.1 recombination mediator RecR [Pseudodesulfovibrio sp. S3-i]RWU05812.1 recombination protein RecR [Pseudodesulfovibrio sp. S3]